MKLPFASLAVCVLLGGVAQAEDLAQDPRITDARKACVAGEVQKGIHILADLYVATDDPIWIFNQARCYQQNNQPADALARFKEFLRKSNGGPDDEDVKDARKYIAEIEADLQRSPSHGEKKTVAGEEAAEQRISSATSTESATVRRPDESLTVVPERESAKPPIYKRWWFLTGAVAVLAAGTVTAVLLSRGSGSSLCDGVGPNCLGYR